MKVTIEGIEKEIELKELIELIEKDFDNLTCSIAKIKPIKDNENLKKCFALFRLLNELKEDKSEYTEIKVSDDKSVYIRAIIIKGEDLSDALDVAYDQCRLDERIVNTIPYNPVIENE